MTSRFSFPRALAIGLAAALFPALAAFRSDPKGWLSKVPPSAQAQKNPFQAQKEARVAGQKLYQRHCASCHGNHGEGVRGKPAVRTQLVKEAPPGALFWLLTNGAQREGMPSWSRLPEERRWQIVTYLQSSE